MLFPCKTSSDGSPTRSVGVSRVNLAVRTIYPHIPACKPNNLIRFINFRGTGLHCKVPFAGLTSMPSVQFLNYHILNRPVYMSNIRSDLRYRFKTNAREWMSLRQDAAEEPITIDGKAKIIRQDLDTTNGVMHIIDSVLVYSGLKDKP